MNEDVKKIIDDAKIELKDEFKLQIKEVKAESAAWYKSLGLWSKVAVVAGLSIALVAFDKYAAPLLSPVTNVTVVNPPQTPPVVANATLDRAVVERADASRLLAKVLRSQVNKQLQEEGLKSAGVDGKPLSKSEAVALSSNLEDEHLVAIAQLSGAIPSEGRILDTITSILRFLIEHKDAVKKIVELIILLLAAFV